MKDMWNLGIPRRWKFLGLMALGLLGGAVRTAYGQTAAVGSWWVDLGAGLGYVAETVGPGRMTPLWGAGAWVALSTRAALGIEFQHERVWHEDYAHPVNYFLISFQVWLAEPRLLARVSLGRVDDGGEDYGPAIGFSVGYAFPLTDRLYLTPKLVYREHAFEDVMGSSISFQLNLVVSSPTGRATK